MTPAARPRRHRRLRHAALAFGAVLVLCGLGYGSLRVHVDDAIGARAQGERLARVERSAQWRQGSFVNPLERIDGPVSEMMRAWFFGGQPHREPDAPIPVEARVRQDYEAAPASGLRTTWLGHSTVLVEIDGARVLIDPVWGERASPITFAGPARFFAPPLPMSELPDIDVVVISHDHYDHLDTPTVHALVARSPQLTWAVPLGVGAHLEKWGVHGARIREGDWWESTDVAHAGGTLSLTAVPARHFSGRWLDDSGQTLWAGWVMRGAAHRVYVSGDTALFPELQDIGERLGPFDLTIIEVGAYDRLWTDVHLGPEQAVLAHRLVRGGVLLPVHWGLFDLALHGWTEPMERTLAAAARVGVRVVAPKPGGRFELADAREPAQVARWWPAVAWQTVEQAPAFSSGVASLLASEVR